uniref:RE73276p n=1 Tax=Drosophila melanogaster TaxID=7227 RepID=Q86NS2_DROME
MCHPSLLMWRIYSLKPTSKFLEFRIKRRYGLTRWHPQFDLESCPLCPSRPMSRNSPQTRLFYLTLVGQVEGEQTSKF